MFGSKVVLDQFIDTIARVKPSFMAIGTHHYVQMSESAYLAAKDPLDFDSVKYMVPTGAAVPSSCKKKVMERFPSLKVMKPFD